MILAFIFVGPVIIILAIVGWVVLKRKALANQKPDSPHLNVEELQTKTLLQAVADGVIVFDTSKKITLINPAGGELTGWPADEAVSLDIDTVVKLDLEDGKPLSDANNPFTEVMHAKQAVKKNVQMTSRSGKKMIVSLVVSPIVLPPKYELIGAVAVIRDISRQYQEEMQRAEFISTASHEMRTPVAAIEGYLALAMNENVSKIDSKAREYLDKAHSSTKHLGKLFQDLLTSAKAEDGRLSNQPVVVNMTELLEQITQDLKFAAEKKSLGMEFILNSGSSSNTIDATDSNSKVIPPLYYVYADPDRLHEVLTNLVDNAIKYTDTGKISIGLTGNNEVVQIFVRDTGPGIAPEDSKHLFQKFYRVNNALTRTEGGTGLGLFISRKIIELYNGRIWVESQVGKGATFYINLPRLSSQKAIELQAKTKAQPFSQTV